MEQSENKFCMHPMCRKPINGGRANKKYCCNRCRSAHYQIIHHQPISAERQLTKGNRDNERVLKQLLERLPMSTKYKNCIDISKETLCGAGYNLTYTGMAIMVNWEGQSIKALRYNDVLLISHPHEPSRYLISKYHDRNTQ
jgi:hypothetical protein